MGQGDHDGGREARIRLAGLPFDDPALPPRLARFDGIHSCCAMKSAVTAYGWHWIFARLRRRRGRRQADAVHGPVRQDT